jgi:hypothetical protein
MLSPRLTGFVSSAPKTLTRNSNKPPLTGVDQAINGRRRGAGRNVGYGKGMMQQALRQERRGAAKGQESFPLARQSRFPREVA